jgi:hypothetical protein
VSPAVEAATSGRKGDAVAAVAAIAVRPEVPPEVVAVMAAAVDAAWPRPRLVVDEDTSRPPVWRFSGRWWSRPPSARRMRPWA